MLRPFLAFWRWMFPPTVADMDRQSKLARLTGGMVIVVACLGIILLSIFYGRKLNTVYKNYRANLLVQKSRELGDKNMYVDAINLANEAFTYAPNNPEAIRNIARYATLLKRDEAKFLWNKLESTGQMTLEDKVWEVRAKANLQEYKNAAEQVAALLSENSPTRELIEVADQVLTKVNRRDQLIQILKTYTDSHPDDLEALITLSVRQIQHGDTVDKQEGLQNLWKVAENQEKPGLTALEILDRLNLSHQSDLEKLASLLEKHPLAKEEHRVAALRRVAELHPERKKQIILDAMATRREAKREELVPLARWISYEASKDPSYAEQLIDFLPEDQVLDYIPLLENYLNALTVLKRNDELERLIKDSRARLTPAQKAFFLMHLAFIKGARDVELDEKIATALVSAQSERRADMVMKLAEYAEVRGRLLVAEQAYRSATTFKNIEREAFDGLLRLSYRNGNSKGFMEAAIETAQRWPENQFYLERAAYAALLSGFEMESAIQQAQRLYEERPEDSQRKLIIALAQARQMAPKEAVKYLERINLSDLSLGQGAVLCGIMKAAGIEQQSRTIADQIPEDTLMLPEEKRFLHIALQ